MPTLIDVDKVTQAFDFLSETEQGRTALAQLQAALGTFQQQIQPQTNRGEFIYICRGLMDGMNVREQPAPADVSGYAQVPAAFFAGQPGALTHAASPNVNFQALNRVGLSGFNIRFVA